ncbi:TBC1 domain family member 5 [Planococcus citri]|uniref:TBC1 domain family member 5 n=1 Tax=Planococcus citri TaxID=170843 RepID=UPI0031F8F912
MFYVPSPVSEGISENEEATERTTNSNSPAEETYENEWNNLTSQKDINVLKNYACEGNLRSSSIRSIYWRVFLDIFPISLSEEWLNIARCSRKTYNEMKNDFSLDPRTSSSLPDDNPLSQDENSVWYKYFCDNELKRVIKQDVVRTSPEKAFFQQSNIQEIMINVLFNYARQNPKICYRQGMHEILAPLVLVLHEDYEAFEQAKQTSVINSFISEILDSNYLEADVFHLFSFIMCHMAKYYDVGNVPTASGHFPSQNFSSENNDSSNEISESPICSHLNDLKDTILSSCDRQLYDYLIKLNIPFTAFGIRWLRLLYGREFPFRELLILWDAIFAVQPDFDLVDYIIIAMLIAIRDKLLSSDYMECLNCLMKYPATVNITFVVNFALYIHNPMSYQKPSTKHLNVISSEQSSQDKNNTANKTHNLKPNSNKHLNIAKKFKNLKMNPMKKNSSKDHDFNLVDDYSTKTFEVVVTELKHMRVVMSLCKLKLYQYHEILTASVSSEDTKAQQALTGIQELCTLLDIDHFSLKSSDNSNNSDIETGREAREVQFAYPECSSSSFSRPSIDAVALYLPPPNSDIDMKIFKRTECETTDFSKFPVENPLKLNNRD